MKKENVKRLIGILLIVIIMSICSVVNAESIETTGYSKRYEEWINLPEEEREGTIAPLPFNIRNDKSNEGLF